MRIEKHRNAVGAQFVDDAAHQQSPQGIEAGPFESSPAEALDSRLYPSSFKGDACAVLGLGKARLYGLKAFLRRASSCEADAL